MGEKIDRIVANIYDPEIENPEKQQFLRLVIKAWIRDGIIQGMRLGREDLAFELETTIKKSLAPGAKVVIIPMQGV